MTPDVLRFPVVVDELSLVVILTRSGDQWLRACDGEPAFPHAGEKVYPLRLPESPLPYVEGQSEDDLRRSVVRDVTLAWRTRNLLRDLRLCDGAPEDQVVEYLLTKHPEDGRKGPSLLLRLTRGASLSVSRSEKPKALLMAIDPNLGVVLAEWEELVRTTWDLDHQVWVGTEGRSAADTLLDTIRDHLPR